MRIASLFAFFCFFLTLCGDSQPAPVNPPKPKAKPVYHVYGYFPDKRCGDPPDTGRWEPLLKPHGRWAYGGGQPYTFRDVTRLEKLIEDQQDGAAALCHLFERMMRTARQGALRELLDKKT